MPRAQLRPDVARQRRSFRLARFEPLAFLDESGAKTNLTRLRGRSPVGERCVDHTAHGHWHTTTMTAAIRPSGVFAPMLLAGPMDALAFETYVQQCLTPQLREGEIVVMDHLASHTRPAVRQAIEAVGCDLWYLPPYSPDLNPIEKLWSKAKAHLRRAKAATFDQLCRAVGAALQAVRHDECGNYFTSCGYGW